MPNEIQTLLPDRTPIQGSANYDFNGGAFTRQWDDTASELAASIQAAPTVGNGPLLVTLSQTGGGGLNQVCILHLNVVDADYTFKLNQTGLGITSDTMDTSDISASQTALDTFFGAGNTLLTDNMDGTWSFEYQGTYANTDVWNVNGVLYASPDNSVANVAVASFGDAQFLVKKFLAGTGGDWHLYVGSVESGNQFVNSLSQTISASALQTAIRGSTRFTNATVTGASLSAGYTVTLPEADGTFSSIDALDGSGYILPFAYARRRTGLGYRITFQNGLANTNVPQITETSSTIACLAAGINTVGQVLIPVYVQTFGVTPVYEVQRIAFSESPDAGNFRLSYGASPVDLNYNDSLATVDAGIETILTGGDTVVVTSDGSGIDSATYLDVTWDQDGPKSTFTYSLNTLTKSTGDPTVDSSNVDDQFITLTGGPDAGKWSINGGSATLTFNESDANVEAYIETATGVGVIVTRTGSGTSGSPYSYEVVPDSPSTLSALTATSDVSPNALRRAVSVTITETTPGVSGVKEVQVITLQDGPDAGTWQPAGTTVVAFDATAGQVETALETDLSLGVGVTGSAGGPYTVTFDDKAPQSLIVSTNVDLTRLVTTTIATEQEGGASGNRRRRSIILGVA